MATTTLDDKLRAEYQQLFDTCLIRPAHAPEIEQTAKQIAKNETRYRGVADPLGLPWFFVGVIHCMEASLRFDQHLHNGDPLTARTVQVPKGRPKTGEPTFTWEESATDALTFEGFANQKDWSLPVMLFRFEKYNGFGYRSRHINTPYLWSFSNHYTAGKFAADGVFSPVLVSKQCGAAVLIRRLAEMGAVHFDLNNEPSDAATIAKLDQAVGFDPKNETAAAALLQAALNHFPGISLAVDGVAGERTSDAVRRVTGHFLAGDPRATT
jgi:lysozyme family protein